MDRREFIKKSAMAVAAGAVMASPIGSVMAQEDHLTMRKMKVLLINGSPRKGGNTFLALTEAAKQLGKNGIDTEIVQIGTKAVHGCVACNHCSQTGRCVFDDDLCNTVIDKMAQADALIVGSPTYYGQPNGTVLSLVQPLSYAASHVMQNKPAAAVAVCRRGGASAVYQTLLMPFQMLNMPVVTSQYWNIVYGQTPGQAAQDEEGMQTMRTLGRNMAWMIRKLNVSEEGHPKLESPLRTNFIR